MKSLWCSLFHSKHWHDRRPFTLIRCLKCGRLWSHDYTRRERGFHLDHHAIRPPRSKEVEK